MRSYNSIDDDCEEVPATIDIKVSDGNKTTKPLVRLEVSERGSPAIRFDIRSWDTGLKLVALIKNAMNDAIPPEN